MSDELDPTIAALLHETVNSTGPEISDESNNYGEKQFEAKMAEHFKSESDTNTGIKTDEIREVDLSITHFDKSTFEKKFLDEPSPVFDDPNYYKACLTGEGESSQRLHQILVKYLNCQDKNDKTVYRQQIVNAYWEFLRTLSQKVGSPSFSDCKKMAFRFGVVLPSLFSPEQKTFFAKSIPNNNTGEPVLYMDEWIKEIVKGRMKLSTTDEVPTKSKGPQADQQRIMALKSKNSGKLQSAENLVNIRESERRNLEIEIQERVKFLCEHEEILGLQPHRATYTDLQKKAFSEITNRFHELQKIDRELNNYLRELKDAKEIESNLDAKSTAEAFNEPSVGKDEILSEMNTIRQMAKMTCGRQGNQFPIMTREFFHCMDIGTGFRENVLQELEWIESIDPECFCRIHRGVSHRIVPYVLLVPTYGDNGFCWEPFDRFNRVTSRGRIVIPMYPRDLKIACLMAVADLRWQVAKEKASFDWMSDGLTGRYYQYLEENKMKGDIKQFFIDDYILWITKEANGTQKLPKEVRDIFWRYMPFTQERKDELKMRSLVYLELCKKDYNRSISDGY